MADVTDRNSIAQIKRFLERWVADPGFRDDVGSDPRGTVSRNGILVDPLEIRPLWEPASVLGFLKEPDRIDESWSAPVRQYRMDYREKVLSRDRIRQECAPREVRFRKWRARQMARTDSQLSPKVNEQIVHAPFCIEISKGCSVGCWFCGISAPRLTDVVRYTPENRQLWRDTLEVLRDLCGPAAGHGFCYWATDPLDNPDYERFCEDFHEILGTYPLTTTALALRDPERTRALLLSSAEKGAFVNRFSVLSLSMLQKTHAEFTAEELLHVECLGLNRESDLVKANTGRFRERALSDPSLLEKERRKLEGKVLVERDGRKRPAEIGEEIQVLAASSTIACVSGFLVNMCDRSVKLISPCAADDARPDGYVVFDQSRFTDAADLVFVLERMISRHMTSVIPPERVPRFRPDLKYQPVESGFVVSTPFQEIRFVNPELANLLADAGSELANGDRQAGPLTKVLAERHGVPVEKTLALFQLMWKRGIIDDLPREDPRDAFFP